MFSKRLAKDQQEKIVDLIQKNKVQLTTYIRSQFKDVSDSQDCQAPPPRRASRFPSLCQHGGLYARKASRGF